MQLQNRELALPALAAPEIRPAERDIATLRRHVISGDWTPINNGTCTLTDLGLRHNGNGLVWLHSGVSVHETDSDTGLAGSDKVSHEYHEGVCAGKKLSKKAFIPFVQASKVERFGFKHVAIDGKWLYVYDDHIRFLTRKRHRVNGVRVQGYTANGVRVDMVA